MLCYVIPLGLIRIVAALLLLLLLLLFFIIALCFVLSTSDKSISSELPVILYYIMLYYVMLCYVMLYRLSGMCNEGIIIIIVIIITIIITIIISVTKSK